jgi:hypothetical protein
MTRTPPNDHATELTRLREAYEDAVDAGYKKWLADRIAVLAQDEAEPTRVVGMDENGSAQAAASAMATEIIGEPDHRCDANDAHEGHHFEKSDKCEDTVPDVEPRSLVKVPCSHEDDTNRDDQNDKRHEAVVEALAQLEKVLKEPVNEETRARWFAPEILCAQVILQDHKPDQFGALSELLRSRKIVYMKHLESALAAHRAACSIGHAPLPPSARLLTASPSTQLVNLAHAEHVELFHDSRGQGYVTLTVDGHKETWPISNKGFTGYLRARFRGAYGKVPAGQAVRDAVEMLEAEAARKGAEHRVSLRIAEHDGRVYLDMCNEKWEAVEITSDGWRVVSNPPVKFVRMKGMLPLPTPERGGTVDELRSFVNVASERDVRLLVAFLLSALQPERPKLGLAVSGEQGSGKSALLKVLRQLLDPNEAEKRPLPKDVRSLMIAGVNSAMLSFDNVSRLSPDIADALCSIMTGAGHAERALYTDADETLFKMTRAVMLNGIPDLTERGDLADRMIVLMLPEIREDQRQDEGAFWTGFEAARPRILGALCDAVAGALRDLPAVSIKKLPRMADAAKWVTAAERALGWNRGTFLADFQTVQQDASDVVLEGSPVPPALERCLRGVLAKMIECGQTPPDKADATLTYRRTATELHKELLATGLSDDERRRFPKAPNALGTELRRLAPALRSRGVHVTFERETDQGRGRVVRITAELSRLLPVGGCASA